MSRDWVTQTEAAARETAAGRPLTQGNVSRYLVRWAGEIPVERDDRGRIARLCYRTFAEHRAGNLGVADKLQTRQDAPAPLFSAPLAPVSAPPQAREATPVDPRAAEASTRKRMAEAERAEIALQEQKRLLIPRQAAIRAVETAGTRFVQGLERRRRTLAQRLVGLDDVRAVETLLKEADRALLEALVQDLTAVATGLTTAESGEEEGQQARSSLDSGFSTRLEPAFS